MLNKCISEVNAGLLCIEAVCSFIGQAAFLIFTVFSFPRMAKCGTKWTLECRLSFEKEDVDSREIHERMEKPFVKSGRQRDWKFIKQKRPVPLLFCGAGRCDFLVFVRQCLTRRRLAVKLAPETEYFNRFQLCNLKNSSGVIAFTREWTKSATFLVII